MPTKQAEQIINELKELLSEKERNHKKIETKKEKLYQMLCKKDYKKEPDCSYCVFQETNDCQYIEVIKTLNSEGE